MMLRSSWLVRVWLGGVPLLARASDVVQNCVIDLGSKVPKELGWIWHSQDTPSLSLLATRGLI